MVIAAQAGSRVGGERRIASRSQETQLQAHVIMSTFHQLMQSLSQFVKSYHAVIQQAHFYHFDLSSDSRPNTPE
jgi:hypothetical protein